MSDENPTFIDQLQQAGVITNKVFGLYLNTGSFNSSGYGNPASNLQIGGYDLQTYSTTSTFAAVFDVSEAAWWTVAFTSCSMDGLNLATSFTGIFDSGTSLTIVPATVLVEIYKYLVNTKGKSCEVVLSLAIILCVDDGSSSWPGLTLTTTKGSIKASAKTLWNCASGECILLIQAGGDTEWIFGDSFLRTYYTVYDMDHLTVSFAPAVGVPSGSQRMALVGFLAFIIGFS
jgi:hypothetical protein